MLLWSILIIVIILLSCRFMPGPKCITYCKFRQIKYKWSKERLKDMSTFDPSQNNKFISIHFGDLDYERLCKLYNNSKPYGCSELLQEIWFIEARNALKEYIVEKQLLEE